MTNLSKQVVFTKILPLNKAGLRHAAVLFEFIFADLSNIEKKCATDLLTHLTHISGYEVYSFSYLV